MAFRGWLETTTGQPAPVTPVSTRKARERLAAALSTIVASDLDTLMQLQRLARNEPVQAATEAFTEAMQGSHVVTGWKRALEPDACQLCRWWWRNGRIWRADHPMPRHTGCTCNQIPTTEATDNYQTEGQSAARKRERKTA